MALIESIHFQNFKVLKDATLPLSRCTVLIGANGSGKSTVFQGLEAFVFKTPQAFQRKATAGLPRDAEITVTVKWCEPENGEARVSWRDFSRVTILFRPKIGNDQHLGNVDRGQHNYSLSLPVIRERLQGINFYSLDARAIAAPVQLAPQMQLNESGGQLAGVLDRIRDEQPEQFERLNDELGRWFPEFDRILFSTPAQGQRAFLLRTRRGKHAIPAADLSQGTLLALVILTLAYVPEQPSLVCIEEPDRGIHPRLLVEIRDALYRLSHPESVGEDRPPVQVITTTHSPYFLDLFRDHPEDIVIAQKTEEGARFERLSDRPDIDEIRGTAPLGEVWFSGILGGVPVDQP